MASYLMAIYDFQALEAFKESSILVWTSSVLCIVLFKPWHKDGSLVEAGQGYKIFCWSHSGFWVVEQKTVDYAGLLHTEAVPWSLILLQLPQGVLQPSKQPRENIAKLWFQPRISVLNPQTRSMGIMPTVPWHIYECVCACSFPGFLIALTIILTYDWIQIWDNLHLRVLKSCPRSSELVRFLFKICCKSRGVHRK